jgi:hypothetical protein
MTKFQAIALQTKWNEQVHAVPCDHTKQEMENTVTGYLTGRYHCVVCGLTIVHPSAASPF